MPDSLQLCWEIWVSLHFVRSRPWLSFSSLFGASNQPCCLFQRLGTTLWVHLRRPLVFLVVPTCWETCFSSRRYSIYFFLFFFFWTIIQAILPTMMLGYYLWVHLRCPLNFLYRCFDLLEAFFL
jgi:hypothetical protein